MVKTSQILKKPGKLIYGIGDGGTDHKNRLRVRLTFTMNGFGILSVTFITVTGLNKKDLPKEKFLSGFLHVLISGICSGASQGIQNKAVGHLAMYHKESYTVTGTITEE